MLTGGSQVEADTVGMDLAATVRVWRGELIRLTALWKQVGRSWLWTSSGCYCPIAAFKEGPSVDP